MTENSDSQPPRTQWSLVVLLGALSAFPPLALDLYLPALPAIGQGLGASGAQVQGTMASFFLGMAIGQLFYGPASDRVGRKPAALVGATVFFVASVVCAMATSIEMLVAARFAQALGACAGAVISRAAVRDMFGPTETARMLSLMMLIMGLAPVLAPLAGSYILLAAGWRACFWVLAGFGALMVLSIGFGMRESRSTETHAQSQLENPFQAYAAVLKQRRVLGYCLCGALNGAMIFTYLSNAPGLIIGHYGISPTNFGWVFGVNAAAMIVSSQVNRRVLRYLTPDQVLLRASIAGVMVAGALVAASVVDPVGPWLVLPVLFVLMGTYGFLQGNTMAGALNADPTRAGSTSALLGSGSFAVGAIAASITGLLSDGTPLAMTATIFVAQLGSAVALRRLALAPDRARG